MVFFTVNQEVSQVYGPIEHPAGSVAHDEHPPGAPALNRNTGEALVACESDAPGNVAGRLDFRGHGPEAFQSGEHDSRSSGQTCRAVLQLSHRKIRPTP